MSDFDSLYPRNLYFTQEQQDLLFGNPPSSDADIKAHNDTTFDGVQVKTQQSPILDNHNGSTSHEVFSSPSENAIPGSGSLSLHSPLLDFNYDPDFDGIDEAALIGDLPGTEVGEKRKSIDGLDGEESGKKRKESDEKIAKKPGRKPLTSEPTTKRKAQNRAAQRAFRERKEKHLKDLETKVEDLEKESQAANQENSLLRAQIERLQIELKEYRKRISLMGGNGLSNLSTGNSDFRPSRLNSEFSFDFPKFGDLPGGMFNEGSQSKSQRSSNQMPSLAAMQYKIPGVMNRDMLRGNASFGQQTQATSTNGSTNFMNPQLDAFRSIYGRAGAATRNSPQVYSGSTNGASSQNGSDKNRRQSSYSSRKPGIQDGSNTNSPSTSSESHRGRTSSIGTSPEPSAVSPMLGMNDQNSTPKDAGNNPATLDECQKNFYEKLNEACGCAEDPIPAAFIRMKDSSHPPGQQTSPETNTAASPGSNWLVQQNGGQFDPDLFNDYREPQDAVLSQDFGSFFNDAFPLGDLGNPFQGFDLGVTSPPPAPKPDLISQIDQALEGDEEVVPGEDRSQMMTCTKIWDRLQSMEKFRNGEIDVDSLCTELRTKARCSEGGVVVNKKDVEDIMTRAK